MIPGSERAKSVHALDRSAEETQAYAPKAGASSHV
jgi:hypothetical protein